MLCFPTVSNRSTAARWSPSVAEISATFKRQAFAVDELSSPAYRSPASVYACNATSILPSFSLMSPMSFKCFAAILRRPMSLKNSTARLRFAIAASTLTFLFAFAASTIADAASCLLSLFRWQSASSSNADAASRHIFASL